MYELDKEKFGKFVAKLRKEKGYTQKELAKQLSISDKAVSKWETGVTIPDVALLIPLSELLGVTVTELLTGERLTPQQPMMPDTVEELVKTAIVYSETTPTRAWQEKNNGGILYLFACLAEAVCLMFLSQEGGLTGSIWTNAILTTLFGAYFCFFVQTKLPHYYDEHKISGMYDGVFRMNVPGLYFNNRNWLHIIKTGRISMTLNMVLIPLLALLFGKLAPHLWQSLELYVMLFCVLGGLFVPIYIVGKKYE